MRFIFFLLLCVGCTKKIDLGIDQLKGKNSSFSGVYLGQISSVQEKQLSPYYTRVLSFKLKIEKPIAVFPSDEVKSDTTDLNVVTDLNMIFPFEPTILDQRENLEVNERIIVYAIKEDGKYIATHISKVVGEVVKFPNKAVGDIELPKFENLVKKNFESNFR